MTAEHTSTPEEPQNATSNPQPKCAQPGKLLQEAREKQGISAEKAAKDLNFLPNYIPALETENFKPLHNATFIKGYLRAYARYLNIDADEVLRCFGEHYPELAVQQKTLPVEVMPPEKSKAGVIFKLLSLTILLALLALVVLWWQAANDDLPVKSTTSVKVETLEGTIEVTELAPSQEEPEVSPAAEAEQPEAAADETPAEAPAAKPKASEEKPAATPAANDANPASSAAAKRLEKLFTGNLYTSATGRNQLGLSFTSECWVEVKDANNRLVHSDLMNANEQLLLEGRAPFKVVFGNGKAAKAIYLGQDFDFSSNIRRNGYTSFQLGAN